MRAAPDFQIGRNGMVQFMRGGCGKPAPRYVELQQSGTHARSEMLQKTTLLQYFGIQHAAIVLHLARFDYQQFYSD
jgi:hypothetical protein